MLDYYQQILENDTYYPTSDGRPMGETDTHREQLISLIKSLEYFYRDQSDVYVSGNILMFYEEGNGRRHRSPDVLIALGVEKKDRDGYKIWEEGKAPDVVFEVTSKTTRTEDLGEKKGLYALLGVKEYVIFDPLSEYLEPQLRVYRLAGDDYIRVAGDPLRLEAVGLDLKIVDDTLRLLNGETGEILLTPEERADFEAQRAEEEAQRAEEEAQRAEEEAQRATEEAKRAEEEAKRAEEEAKRADAAIAKVRELEAKLRELES